MLKGLSTADLADSIDDACVAHAFHAIGRCACLGLQEPVENRQFGAVFPATHREIRLVVFPYPEEYETAQQILGGEDRSEEHTSELQSLRHLVCRLLLEKK